MCRFTFYPVSVIAALVIAASCSVKEDRSGCPCTVSVMTQTDSNCVVNFHEGAQLLERKCISASLLCSGENWTGVKRGMITVSAARGTSLLEFTDSSVYCRSGQQFGQVSALSKTVSTDCESVLVNGELNKQYCIVRLYVKGASEAEYPYKVLFKAPCNGMIFSSLAPASGQFIYESLLDSAGSCRVCLPRQKSDDDLYLEMTRQSGKAVGIVNLGKYFLAAGYDWEAESLDDITIVMDFSVLTISIKVNDWIQVFILKYEI